MQENLVDRHHGGLASPLVEAQFSPAWLFARLPFIDDCRLLLRVNSFGIRRCSYVDLLQLVKNQFSVFFSQLFSQDESKMGKCFLCGE